MSRVQTSEFTTIKILALDSSGVGVTGATIDLLIFDEKYELWWTGSTFDGTPTTLTMDELDASNLPGVYSYRFEPSHSDTSCILYASTSDVSVVNGPWADELTLGGWVDNIDASVDGLELRFRNAMKKLGLSQLESAITKRRNG